MNNLDELITENFENKVRIHKLRRQLTFLQHLLNQEPPKISPKPFYKYINNPQELENKFRAISLDLIEKFLERIKTNPERFSSKLLIEILAQRTAIASSNPDYTSDSFLDPEFDDYKTTLNYKQSLSLDLYNLAKHHFNYEKANELNNLTMTKDKWDSIFNFMFESNYRTPELVDIQPAVDAYINKTVELEISIEELRTVTKVLIDYFEHLMISTTNASYYFTSDAQPNIYNRFNNFFGVLSYFI